MAGRLTGKVALITGAGGGQGRAAAVLFAREGAQVIVTDVKIDGGEETVQMVKAAGGQAVFQATDVAQAAQVEEAVRVAVKTYGALHIMYNNAAVLHRKDAVVTNLEEDIWNHVIDVNLKGVYLGCKYAVPELIKAGGGSIINVSSLAGLIGIGNVHAYTAAKGGVISLTRAVAMGYAAQKVRCNVICPGGVDTPMMAHVFHNPNPRYREMSEKGHPLGRLGAPEDIAYMALYLASDESSWVTGSVFTIDGGYSAR
ncbi:MAG TPA: glucose 1-dehydrogenase [Methylomirabilota bacterium]|jgi:NAD(P)-dependent dehydrogenase (short-subunit alcohol dehydrogenase family)|nr:glucose 1-dehydrogenase [Methylomirabilota bacterium]